MSEFYHRVERGLAIAKAPGDIETVRDDLWSVRSQSSSGVYLVSRAGGRWNCICPDFVGQRMDCKHIIAVKIQLGVISPKAAVQLEATRPRPTYRQDWSAYNAAQRAELSLFDLVLGDLVANVSDPLPPKGNGRPRLPLRDVLYCAVQKVYQDLPLRVARGLNDRLHEEGRTTCSPSANMSSNAFRRPDLTPILNELIAKSALALSSVETTFAVDSSGFRTTAFGDYCREKYGALAHNVWKKAHIIVGTKTQIIPQVVVTDGHAADCPYLPQLVNGTIAAGFVLKEVYADKGYVSGENFRAIGEAGGVPYIRFKDNSRGRGKKQHVRSPFWKQMWHLFQTDPSGYLEHYHKRVLVEATFAAIKKKLGETLSSKDPVAQVNELLAKVLAHNIQVLIHEAFEHGVALPGVASGKENVGSANATSPRVPPNQKSVPTEAPVPEGSWGNN